MGFRRLDRVLAGVMIQIEKDMAAAVEGAVKEGRAVTPAPVADREEQRLIREGEKAADTTERHTPSGLRLVTVNRGLDRARPNEARPALARSKPMLMVVAGSDHPTGSSLARYARSQRLQ